MIPTSNFFEALSKFRTCPSLVQRMMIDQVEKAYNQEIELVDPTNPFVFLLEASAITSADNALQSEVLSRRQYRKLATSYEDLYYHMSDRDYIDRFATPSTATFTFLLDLDELKSVSVPVEGVRYRKVTIPRHTEISVGGFTFSMQYPIDIFFGDNGTLNIVYDNSSPSPIENLTSNGVEWRVTNYNQERVEMLQITTTLKQMRCQSWVEPLTAATIFEKSYAYEDYFYYCRAYYTDRNGTWHEMSVTHNSLVYDPYTPTIAVTVTNNVIKFTLPQIYYNSGIVVNELRFDVYTTKGKINVTLDGYKVDEFTIRTLDRDPGDMGIYHTPLNTLSTFGVFSRTTINSGSNGLQFDELKRRIIANSYGNGLGAPVIESEVSELLNAHGFSCVKYRDTVRDRAYIATRAIPDIYPAPRPDLTMIELTTTLNLLSGAYGVVNNGVRLTITPDSVFMRVNGVAKALTTAEYTTFSTLPLTDKISVLNSNDYLCPLFHYMVDYTGDISEVRGYNLDTPTITGKHFIESNDTVPVSLEVLGHTVERVSEGYAFKVLITGNDKFAATDLDDIRIDLMLTDGENRAGVRVSESILTEDGNRVYTFLLKTPLDINENHKLKVTNVFNNVSAPTTIYISLDTTFTLLFFVRNSSTPMVGVRNTAVYPILNDLILRNVSHSADTPLYAEQVTVTLGMYLDTLWTNGRRYVGAADYARYDADVYDTYTEPVYTLNGTELTLLHRAGDRVLDDNGAPVLLHRAGDVVTVDGTPVVRSPRDVSHTLSFPCIDARYLLAEDAKVVETRKAVTATLTDWLSNELYPLEKLLIEDTDFYYMPTDTMGITQVTADGEEGVTINVAQQLTVTLYVDTSIHADFAMRNLIRDKVVSVVREALDNDKVVSSGIVTSIMSQMSDGVKAVDFSGLGGDANYTIITDFSGSKRLGIGKLFTNLSDGTTTIVESIDVVFIKV